MVTSTLITDYAGAGTHAARPASPNIPTGATALYYETDTANTFAWTGAAWVKINGAGGGTTPTIVQNASNAGAAITGVTFGAAPTNGNLMIAFVDDATGYASGAGWTQMSNYGGGIDYASMMWKVAGVGESVNQNPISAAAVGSVTIFELANAAPSLPFTVLGTTATFSTNIEATRTGGLLIGAYHNQQTIDLPTSVTGVTDSSSTGGARSTQGFHIAAPTAGLNAVSRTYAAAHYAITNAIVVY